MVLKCAFVTAAAARCRKRLLQRLLLGTVNNSTNLFLCDRAMFFHTSGKISFGMKKKLVEYVSNNECLKDKTHVQYAYATLLLGCCLLLFDRYSQNLVRNLCHGRPPQRRSFQACPMKGGRPNLQGSNDIKAT
jgi:hypothetical protein